MKSIYKKLLEAASVVGAPSSVVEPSAPLQPAASAAAVPPVAQPAGEPDEHPLAAEEHPGAPE